ncbi:MAG: peptidylprolyl isomerase [Acidimicrobiales bacterium]
MPNRRAEQGDMVTVHYTGRLEGGDVFDTSRQQDPLSFRLGEGNLIPGFENGVLGLEVGETRTVRVEPAEGYGDRRDDLVITVGREQAPAELSPNDQVEVSGRRGVITEVTDDHVVADLNHPLAGEALTFEVELIEIA